MDTKESETTLFKVMRDLDAILPRNASKSEININTGGIAVWVALAMFAFMAGLNWSLNAQLTDQNRKIDRMQEHLSAIYVLAPHLRPEAPK